MAIPLIISFYSNRLTEAINDKELKLKYVELSIKILSDAPWDNTSEKSESGKNDSDNIRQWAIDIIDELAPIKMTKATKDELKKKRAHRSTEEARKDKNGKPLKFSRDLESDWTIKNDTPHFDLKEHTAVDVKHGFVLATIHSQASVHDTNYLQSAPYR